MGYGFILIKYGKDNYNSQSEKSKCLKKVICRWNFGGLLAPNMRYGTIQRLTVAWQEECL